MGIEPTFEAWEAPVLPLNYTRDSNSLRRHSNASHLKISRRQFLFSNPGHADAS